MYLVNWKETLPAGHSKGGYPRIPASRCKFPIPLKNIGDIRMAWGHLSLRLIHNYP
jgi:hypothetical protein